MVDTENKLLRRLPAVNTLLERPEIARLREESSAERVTAAVRAVLAEWRGQVLGGELDDAGLDARVQDAGRAVEARLRGGPRPRLRRVINATGVLLQTNLGRAPLGAGALERVAEVAAGYCNLEFALEAGMRGRRDDLLEPLLLAVLGLHGSGASSSASPSAAHGMDAPKNGAGAGAAVEQNAGIAAWGAAFVNNCAAATWLALNTLAAGGEVIVSRGELVEIGGGFRVPEILASSGAVLREIGTTNKTRIGDYAAAIGPQTRLILRVHRSNFEVRGFTEQPSLDELVALGRRTGIPVFEDQGTGCVVDLAGVGLAGEGSLRQSVAAGLDVVAASGDKLLGGPQCGLLIGRADLIARMRSNPLYRALRVDKLIYAALEGTLLAYWNGTEAEDVPVVRMLRLPAEAIRVRCEHYATALQGAGVQVEVVPVRSVVGGGTTPGASLPSFAVRLAREGVSEADLAARMRALETPVVGRVQDGGVVLDLRTVPETDDTAVLKLLETALAGSPEVPGDDQRGERSRLHR